jgi:hypothetical protein
MLTRLISPQGHIDCSRRTQEWWRSRVLSWQVGNRPQKRLFHLIEREREDNPALGCIG